MRFAFFIIFISWFSFAGNAQTFTISGYISDHSSKEILIGATVSTVSGNKGASANSFGFYSLTLPGGQVTVKCRYMGYATQKHSFILKKDTVINISLFPSASELQEIVVTSGNINLVHTRHGVINVPIETIRNTPRLFGERDLMKSLQYIPGVQNAVEGKSDLSIRGGSPDQNLVLLDGNSIYNISHLFGFLSVFNTDALKKVTLYKSGFPARFGGRLSSVIDINTKDGNKERFEGSATLGLLAAKFNIEGPVIKDRTSFTFSARRSYADLFMGKMQEWLDEDDTNRDHFYFYDINAKIHHKFTNKTSFYITAYKGVDRYKNTFKEKDIPGEISNSTTRQDWQWGNTILATRLNTALSGNLFLNTNLSYNQYAYQTSFDEQFNQLEGNAEKNVHNSMRYDSGIKDYAGSFEFEYIPSVKQYVRVGAQFIYHDFHPEVIRFSDDYKGKSQTLPSSKVNADELAVYAEDDWELTNHLTINGGLRFSLFHVNKKTYTAVDPRFSVRYLFNENFSVKAGYSHMQQYIHLLSNNSMLFQTDLWVPVTNKVKPMDSRQYSLGFYRSFSRLFDISVETYYKTMDNVIEYKDGASFSGSSASWEDKVKAGTGRSFGMELSIEKRCGSFSGTFAYAWAKTERRFNEINDGRWFPAKFDRRHTANLNLSYALNKKIDFTTQWTYSSGDMMTIPLMTATTPDIPDAMGILDELTQLDHRNNYRLPSYHRLDIGMNYTGKKRNNRYGVWNFSIYNVYNQMNVFKLYVETDLQRDESGKSVYTKRLRKITLFPILPSISYTCYF